jgi:acyl-coenzyme A thioesterase PaaI-like protein
MALFVSNIFLFPLLWYLFLFVNIGSIPIYVKELSPSSCSLSMRDSYWVRNPFKSIHAAALINLGEACTGLAMLSWMEYNKNAYKGIVTKIEATYYKKARGTIRADTCLNNITTSDHDDVDVPVKALLTDSSNTVVGNVIVYWTIRSVKKNK